MQRGSQEKERKEGEEEEIRGRGRMSFLFKKRNFDF